MDARVLMIDDDVELAQLVCEYLGDAGVDCFARHDAATGLEALREALRNGRPVLAVVLDVMLPDGDGFDVCRMMRADPEPSLANVPILMLTARGDEEDRIVGLELGADDYLPKPFNPRELLARLRAILRRGGRDGAARAATLRFGRLEIDPAARRATVGGEPCDLTSHQFELLLVLARHAGQVLSRDAIMRALRGHDLEAFDRSIDVHVSRIRAAIEDDPKSPRRILTVRGVGYVFAREHADGGP